MAQNPIRGKTRRAGRDWYFADLSGADADLLIGLRFNESVQPLRTLNPRPGRHGPALNPEP